MRVRSESFVLAFSAVCASPRAHSRVRGAKLYNIGERGKQDQAAFWGSLFMCRSTSSTATVSTAPISRLMTQFWIKPAAI